MESKKEIICDKCGAEIDMQSGLLKDRVIAKDKGGNAVSETFFECQACGQHYTVTVMDREMQLMIQKRGQLMRELKRLIKTGGSKEKVQKLQDADAQLKKDLKNRADRLKKEYAGVIG